MARSAQATDSTWSEAKDNGSTASPPSIVDDLHVVYRVYGAGGDKGTAATALCAHPQARSGRPAIREVHAVRGCPSSPTRATRSASSAATARASPRCCARSPGCCPPSSGTVYTDGQPSLLGVNAALMNDLTGERNVVLGCLAMGMTPAEVKERYAGDRRLLRHQRAGDFITLPMRTYSSGMGARLRFSIAAAKNHDVLLIDEALATGDARVPGQSQPADPRAARAGRHGLPGRHNLERDRGDLQPGDLAGEGPDRWAGEDVTGIIDAYLALRRRATGIRRPEAHQHPRVKRA